MKQPNEPALVAREYATLDRLALRRLDRTGWLRFDELDEEQTLLAAIAEVHPTRVLDVGCGDGRIPALYTSPEVVVVDSSADAIDRAVARGLDAQLADARELPFEDSSFDVVTCSHVLYHLPDVDEALAEFVRVLRPGGRFAGIYSMPEDLREVFAESPEPFDGESGLPVLQRHFASVSRIVRGGSVLWLTQRDLQTYLDAYVELYGPLVAPDGPYPFTATRAKCVFVADAA
ncbi:MAG TPA: class I SAM-dependent methyltransferase [Gaiellaceae bacterium]|nr:class I SAM-dependent methyltransferase [Gaiellaceae bacterium]